MTRDFSGQNLQGRSFEGQNLVGVNFTSADIRGANFTNAILKGANFSNAKAGLQKRWVMILVVVSLILSAIGGTLATVPGIWIGTYFFKTSIGYSLYKIVPGILAVIIITTLSITIHKKGSGSFLVIVSIILLLAGTIAITLLVIILGKEPSLEALRALIVGLVGAILSIELGYITAIVAASFTLITTNKKNTRTILISVPTAITITIVKNEPYKGVVSGVLIGILVSLLGIYIIYKLAQSILDNELKNKVIHNFIVYLASMAGTNFYGADLTDADFTGATLKNTNLSKANLTRTHFYEAKELDLARVGNTILKNRDVLNLLVTHNGRGKSFKIESLQGANLKGADLKYANLKEANISEATFEGACLEWANLTLAQAVGTNFTNAQMTGACIEAWNIESTTLLDNVDCRFVYLLEHPKLGTDDRERRPSSGEFKPGDFTKLFQEVLNTVDLIFRDGIDWKAFVTAFKKVQVENEDTELTIQSIENKGDGVLVVKVAVPVDANKEKIHSDFNQNYQLALQAVEEKYKAQLQAKDEQIVIYRQQSAEMKEIISLLANKPVNIYNTQENQNMTNSNDSSRKIEIGTVGGDFNASGQALNLGEIDISGTVTNIINQLPDSPEPENPGIKELLKQLQEAIKAEANLSEEDKNEALEQLKTLAEAGQNPKEGTLQKAAKTAIKILKGTISSLPSAATLVETCSKILPLISQYLGLG